MSVEIKFCGLTRPEDAAHGAAVGASYVGVIFAGGPRQLDPARAAEVLAAAGDGVQRVGVFADQDPGVIARVARQLGLHVVQLHGPASVDRVRRVREAAQARVWAVVRVAGPELPPDLPALDEEADAILFDAFAPGQLGGAGVPFDWRVLSPAARPRRARLVVAGGLTPEIVGAAIRALAPHVVDVSSGVEQAPGVKDHERMRAFAEAVRHHTARSRAAQHG